MTHSDYWQALAEKNARRQEEYRRRQEERLAQSQARQERRLAELRQRQEAFRARQAERKLERESQMRVWRDRARRENEEVGAHLALPRSVSRRTDSYSEWDLLMSVANLSYSAGRALGQRANATPPAVERRVMTPEVARAWGIVPPQPKPTPTWLNWLVMVGVGLGAYKVLQAIFDEEYPGRTLPRRIRNELKYAHLESHGPTCLCCGGVTTFDDLVIDHIVSHKNGGRTSIANSRVICRWCNGAKGAKNVLFDFIRGRGGRID